MFLFNVGLEISHIKESALTKVTVIKAIIPTEKGFLE